MYTGNAEDGYDIALVKLNKESQNEPVSIATNPDELQNQRKVSALGFGISDEGVPADTLQFTNELIVIENVLCKGLWQDVIQDSMLCAFGFEGVDTCPGDSGGPLLVTFQPDGDIEKGIPSIDKVVGVTSFGEKLACGESGIPAVYTRVTSFAEWIEAIIEQESEHLLVSVIPPKMEPLGTSAMGMQSIYYIWHKTNVFIEYFMPCPCSEDGISNGTETGFGGCSRRLEAGAALCYVQSNEGPCSIARASNLFSGASWISCGADGDGESVGVQELSKDASADVAQLNE
ncbi:unnamed protein product, partial [Ostreobium quekettii]